MCASSAAPESSEFECSCGELYDVEHAFGPLDRALFDSRPRSLRAPGDSGVWRYRELVDPDLDPAAVVSLCEGNTPLYDAPDLARFAGLAAVGIKHEGLNPTGSFKDRGMTAAVSRARAAGARHAICASTGNTAASMAAFAARAGMAATVVVPDGAVAWGKLSQALAYGAHVLMVRGDFDAAMGLVREEARAGRVALLNSANPFRVEGQKTIVLEVLQQLAWDAPDWIVFPAGNLGNCAAFGKALREALALGLIERVPRLAAVQAAGAAPFATAYDNGFERYEPVVADTLATAIRIGAPVSYARGVRSLKETRGVALAVTDDEILAAKVAVDRAGLGAEPASCAALAGARRLVRDGRMAPTERVVCVLTGNLLKDPDTTRAFHEGRLAGHPAPPERIRTIDADQRALRMALEGV
ncbi:MAG: threonine synthase [bacterium]|nr:threonine synthase [bacterium]